MKIIISNKSHTLFFDYIIYNSVILTNKVRAAKSFMNKEDAASFLKEEILPYQNQELWFYNYSSFKPEKMIISLYKQIDIFEDL